jgi:hypothetical protein
MTTLFACTYPSKVVNVLHSLGRLARTAVRFNPTPPAIVPGTAVQQDANELQPGTERLTDEEQEALRIVLEVINSFLPLRPNDGTVQDFRNVG